MNSFERRLKAKISEEVPDLAAVTPSLVLDVYKNGKRRGLVRLGREYDFYDLASLTKILFTASASIAYFSENSRALKAPVREQLEWWRFKTSPEKLLTHTAGLDWWQPYFKKLKGPMVPQQRWDQLKKILSRTKPSVRLVTKAVYSDLDLWMMGAFLEAAEGKSLLELWSDVEERLSLNDLFFHPGNKPKYARARYAPTERCSWRGKVLQGEVHDENTWALAGVAPHAGLFGTIEGLSDWGLKLRAAVLNDSDLFGSPAVVRKFTRRQLPTGVGDWGYGFMKPSRGKASCGKYFSLTSFGHTGFTGTSLWMDPKQDLLVCILSNRVHPTRENTRFVKLRPELHNWICQLL